MIVHEKLGIIYLAQPRTASTGIAKALCEKHGFRRVGGHHEYTDEALFTRPGNPKYRAVISGVRRHRSTVESFWRRERFEAAYYQGRRRRVEDLSPSQWLDHFLRSNIWIRNRRLYWRFLPITTHVYRYENLQEDFGRITDELDLEPITLLRPVRDLSTRSPGFDDQDLERIDHYFSIEASELESRYYSQTVLV